MKVYIGIDDTDNLETRGTGHQARTLGHSLMDAGLLKLESVTRHQLLYDRRIPFTSHNSSACLVGETTPEMIGQIAGHCRDFLLKVSAHDSDAGLCIATEGMISGEITRFGNQAKKEVLRLDEACALAAKHDVFLEGYLNTRLGMIGSLSAVGLRFGGNDGRLLWTPNLRETTGVYRVSAYKKITGVEEVTDIDGDVLNENAAIMITDWSRPVMRNGRITLLVEKTENNEKYEYQSASKEYIKRISE